MTAQPVWLTPAGNLGTYPEGTFFQLPLVAEVVDDNLFYRLIAGELPAGVQLTDAGAIVGTPYVNVQGVPNLVSRDTVSKFAVRAYTKKTVNNTLVVNRLADRTFSLTVAGQNVPEFTTPAGLVATYFDGSQVTDLQIGYTDNDPEEVAIVRLIAGALPPGCTITPTGVISGFIVPEVPSGGIAGYSRDDQAFDEYDFDFPTNSLNVNYEFILEVTDGRASNIRTFNIQVYSRDSLTADTTDFTADNTFITADGTPVRPPILLTPEGSIGTVRNDNFYAFQFDAIDLDDDKIRYHIRPTPISADLPPGLTLDPFSGWLYGYIPNTGLTEKTYNFEVRVSQLYNPDVSSMYYSYSLTIIGQIDTDIVWTTPSTAVDRAKNPSPLGTINTGSISTLYVAAVNVDGIGLEYRLKSGSNSSLPQGLMLMPSGNIVGRVSFNTFALDGGTTTFDVDSVNLNVTSPTTFDLEFVFTVEAFNGGSNVSVYKTFSIVVNRAFNTPYENLYIQAMPPQNDRDLINDLLQDTTAIPIESLYRADDPNFGRATQVVYDHAYGLTAATYIDYVSSLYLNHYWKNLVLGEIATAQALDPVTGDVVYEVVYSRVIDNLVNNSGESVGKEVVIPYPINANDSTEIDVVYPNSLINMRDQVIDVVGQTSNLLPLWMLSKQSNGRVLGFTPSWVIAYVNPGQSGQVAYNIRTKLGTALNLIDFQVDRYELDRALTHNWSPEYDQWEPQPPAETTFDLPPDTWDLTSEYVTGNIVKYFHTNYTVNTLNVPVGTVLTNTEYWQVFSPAVELPWIQDPVNTTVWSSPMWPDPVWDPTVEYATGDIVVEEVVIEGVTVEDNVTIYTTYIVNKLTVPIGTLPTNIQYWQAVDATIFDGGSLRFITPVDIYLDSNTQDYDKYLVFPRRNIISPVTPIIPPTVVTWDNNSADPVEWNNDADQPVEWINDPSQL
jgi:hypothetical protein